MPDEERELTPQQEEQVRRLLADSRVHGPVPAAVAAQLDDVLAGLRDEPGAARDAAPVAPAARRRRASALLMAAAAVVAAGVALGQLQERGDDGGDANGSAAETSLTADRESDDQVTDGGGVAVPEAAPADDGESVAGRVVTPPRGPIAVGRVDEESFTADTELLRRGLPPAAPRSGFVALNPALLPADAVRAAAEFRCAAAPWGRGLLVPVLVGRAPAVVAYRPAVGETQVVELLECGSALALRSTTLPTG